MKTARKRILFDDLATGEGTMGSDIIATVLMSQEYKSLKDADIHFRLALVLTYQVGKKFGFGGQMWADVLFEFTPSLTADDQMMLMLRDGYEFSPDMSQYNQPFDTGCDWENKHLLLPNVRAKRAANRN